MGGPNAPLKFSDAPEVNTYDGIEVQKPAHANVHHQTELFEKPGALVKQGTICGFRRPTFFLSLALATVIVLAAAIGGGVGAATCKSGISTVAAQSSSRTTFASPSSTSSPIAPTITPTITPTTTCPFSNNSVYHSLFENDSPGAGAGLDFLIYCDMTLAYQQRNLAQVWAVTLDDCIEACASYNFWSDNTSCGQVAYQVDGTRPGNCWLGVQDTTKGIQIQFLWTLLGSMEKLGGKVGVAYGCGSLLHSGDLISN